MKSTHWPKMLLRSFRYSTVDISTDL